MKKILFVLLGLASLNVHANGCGGEYQPATGTCRIIDSSGRQILYNVGKPQTSNNGSAQSQPRVINIDVPSKYGAWAVNSKTGLSGGALEMDSLAAAKKRLLKLVNEVGKINHVKFWLGYVMDVLQLLRERWDTFFWNEKYWAYRRRSFKEMSSIWQLSMFYRCE